MSYLQKIVDELDGMYAKSSPGRWGYSYNLDHFVRTNEKGELEYVTYPRQIVPGPTFHNDVLLLTELHNEWPDMSQAIREMIDSYRELVRNYPTYTADWTGIPQAMVNVIDAAHAKASPGKWGWSEIHMQFVRENDDGELEHPGILMEIVAGHNYTADMRLLEDLHDHWPVLSGEIRLMIDRHALLEGPQKK